MHFYAETENGIEPKHFVQQVKDPSKSRPSRTTDAKKAAKNGEVWYSSVTTVLNVLDKPAILSWKIDKHLEEAYRDLKTADGGLIPNTFEDYKKVIKARTQEALDAAPKAGTDIHQILEDNLYQPVKSTEITDIERLIVENVEKLLNDKCGGTGWETEKYFIDKELGYAGCADLVSDTWCIDYKSKQETVKFKPGKMAYPEHSRQLAAYGKAMCNDGFKAANIFVCLETGDVDFHEHTQEKLENGFLDFKDCLSIHQRNTYNPKAIA